MPDSRTNNGGKRPGAGRPKKTKPLVAVSVRLASEQVTKLATAYDNFANTSQRARAAISDALKHKQEYGEDEIWPISTIAPMEQEGVRVIQWDTDEPEQ